MGILRCIKKILTIIVTLIIMIQIATRVTQAIDYFTDLIGRAISWLTVAIVITVFIIVVTRYFLQIGSIALQESVMYLHATVFLLGAAYTLQHGGHVRVDIFYRNFSVKRKAMVDLVGSILFLLPVSCLIFYTSCDYVIASWAIRETSDENSGLSFTYVLKTLMLLMPAILLLQGIAEILKNAIRLIGQVDPEDIEGFSSNADNHEPIL